MRARRIAFLLPHFRAGGAERVVLNWIGALDRRRFQPLLMLGRVEGAFLDLLPADIQPIALGGGRALMRPRRIARLLREREVDIAYSATNAMNLALLAASTDALRIVSEHTPPGAYLDEAKWRWLRALAMRRLYRRADAIAVPTAQIGDELATLLGRGPAPVVLPNPVIAAVPATLGARPRGGPLRIVAAGRLVPAKGFDLLVDACARLRAEGHAVRATIHGEGPERDALVRRIVAGGLGDVVTLAGHTDALADALAAADLCVMPSRREGFGNVAIEAMAVGTPVLATRAGGPESFIGHGINGFLAPAGDAAALADAIARLAADPASLEAVRGAALDTARGFTVAEATRRFAALLDRLPAKSMAA